MRVLRSGAFGVYVAGLSSVFLGAWIADVTGSMLPLALSGSAALMCTAPLVRAIWKKSLTT